MKIKGMLSILCSHGSERSFRIQVEDRDACTEFLEITLSPHDFAIALTGMMTPCECTVRNLNQVGMQRQHKTVEIERPSWTHDKSADAAAVRAAVAAHEIEGWRGCDSDLLNDNRSVRGTSRRRVGFTRMVPKEPTP